jgi:RND family efflux transporter MFP subunit
LLLQDLKAFDASVVGAVILALVIVNLVCRLTQGVVIRGFGGTVRQFGIALSYGIPRFFVDLGGIAGLDRRGQLWVHAAPLLARLELFGVGTLLWFALREAAPPLSHLALLVGQVGLLAFLLAVLPLLPSDGYRWLATYFGRPALRASALRSMPGRTSDLADDSGSAAGESSAVTFYVLAAALAVSLLAMVAQAYFDIATSGAVGLLTALVLLGVCIAIAACGIALWNYGRRRGLDVPDTETMPEALASWPDQTDIATDRRASIGTVGKVVWAVILCALLAIAFLPYRYEASGRFEILPSQRIKVPVRTSGAIEQVLVREGDWVKANQALAKLSSDDQQRNITITNAELRRARALLAQFGGSAKADESSELQRELADVFDDEKDAGDAKKDAAGPNYVRAQAERAARAEVERLTHKLAFERDQLAETTVRARTEGRVVTPNVHLLVGTWLRRGSELLSLEDTRTLEAEINLPEADIGLVKVGEKVRLRPWANEDREITGTVTDIAPAAQVKPSGRIVRVRASIPNADAVLRPSMTGYAKIDGEDMRVWEAFLRRIIRIVRVEMWSWIP